ncbi:MAG: ice-binding family protein [Anaerolineaceae bacterium]|nr:ice-binding family protein [Anaerolineaceae bacterium]
MKTNRVLTITIVLILLVAAAGITYTGVIARPYSAATAPGLGAAGDYSLLAGVSASSANMTTLGGSLGMSPGITLNGPYSVGGSTDLGPATNAANAQSDALGAFGNLAGQGSDGTWSMATSPLPGVWTDASSPAFSGTLTLTGDYSDVWVFQISTDFTFSGAVVMAGNAQACNVFWQVARDATIASGSSFIGTLIASGDITVVSGANVSGRILSLNGAVTTDNNTISMPPCNSAAAAGPSLPDNPQPESGSTEAYVGTQTALTATAISSRAGVPSTGGAPLNGEGTLWLILGFSALCVAILFYLTRKIQRNNGSK